jgi:hypothetical protein
MEALFPFALFVAVAVVMGLLFALVWYVGSRIARATHTDTKVDHFFDTDAEMPDEERIKDDGGFREGIGGL